MSDKLIELQTFVDSRMSSFASERSGYNEPTPKNFTS